LQNVPYFLDTPHILTQLIFNFHARRLAALKCTMALTSQQRNWCVRFGFTTTVFEVSEYFFGHPVHKPYTCISDGAVVLQFVLCGLWFNYYRLSCFGVPHLEMILDRGSTELL
jgi:hypothetical protein